MGEETNEKHKVDIPDKIVIIFFGVIEITTPHFMVLQLSYCKSTLEKENVPTLLGE